MKQNKLYLLASFFALIITTFTVSSLVSAATDNKASTDGTDFPPCHMERHGDFEAMQANRAAIDEALTNGDYETWKSLVGENNKFLEVINQDNFSQFIKMHQLKTAGDWEGAKDIAEELGLSQPPGKFMRQFHKFRGEQPAQ